MDKPVRKPRFKLFVSAAIIVLALGNGFTLRVIQQDAHRRCLETRARATATAPALRQLVEAHRLDGDPHATAVWQQYLDIAKQNPIPKC